jgi:hypothetical protein
MIKSVMVFVLLVFLSMFLAPHTQAEGEDILAQSGQYTYFIKPCPGSCLTYYQRMVPCVATETIPVPTQVIRTYQIPVPAKLTVPTMVSEAPVGCAEGQGPCVTCCPKPSCHPGSKDLWGPRMMTVRVPEVHFTPKCVTRNIMLPQWFAVTEQPCRPQKVKKVGTEG